MNGKAPRRRRALGQHHLADPRICRPLVRFLDVAGHDVIEIGPGGGVLTGLLLELASRRVLAIELDPSWAFYLRRKLVDDRLAIAVGDAMDLDWSRGDAGGRLAGNLPYSIATALVERILDLAPAGTRAGFLVQREVAARWLAAPGDADYGSLSVIFAARARGRLLGRVKPGSFVPPPKVESAFVGFEVLAPPDLALPSAPRALRGDSVEASIHDSTAEAGEAWRSFKATVRAGFANRRKTLRNSLSSRWPRQVLEAVLEEWDGDPGRRPQEIGLEGWIDLQRAMAKVTPSSRDTKNSPKRARRSR